MLADTCTRGHPRPETEGTRETDWRVVEQECPACARLDRELSIRQEAAREDPAYGVRLYVERAYDSS